MVFKPRQQNPTESDGEVFGKVIHPPLRMQVFVRASKDFIEAIKEAGLPPDVVAQSVTDRYASNIQRFMDNNRQGVAISGTQQVRRRLNLPGLEAEYTNNQGSEALRLIVSPETSFGENPSEDQRDQLLDGYVFVWTFGFNPGPQTIPGYWLEAGGQRYLLESYIYLGPNAGQPSGVGWSPVNFQTHGYDGQAIAVSTINTTTGIVTRLSVGDRLNVFVDEPGRDFGTINPGDPVRTWGLEPSSSGITYLGGYGTDIPAPPDQDENVTFSMNGKAIGTALVPRRAIGQFVAVLFEFGPDALSEHSIADQLRPKTDKLLNKIIPQYKNSLKQVVEPFYFPFFFPLIFPAAPAAKKISIKRGTMEDFGRNTFTTNTEIGWAFVAEFYDRKKVSIVVQSPHKSPGGLISTNDKSLVWGFEADYSDQSFSLSEQSSITLSNTSTAIINFKDTTEGRFIPDGQPQ